jgi:predicted dehydrogenase
MDSRIPIGVIGCGNISPAYFDAAKRFKDVRMVACADMDLSRAKSRAEQYGIEALTVEQMLAHPEIQIVINLTIPKAHGAVAISVLEAGKHVYNEKPLALDRAEAKSMLDIATRKGLLVGGAPDTFMGAGLQTCRKLIDDGVIGTPIGFSAFMLCHGHENWHPDPEFYYKAGGGPMFDMGPYYLTALVNLLGPITRVSGTTRTTFATRTITSKPKFGQTVTVDVPTHIVSVLDFASGATGTLTTSFDVWHHNMPNIEIYGSEGSLHAPDPNSFAGPVRVALAADYGKKEGVWQDMPLTHAYDGYSRGLGPANMALALKRGEKTHRASGALCYHVLDVMHAIHEASDSGTYVNIASTCERPEPMALDLVDGELR